MRKLVFSLFLLSLFLLLNQVNSAVWSTSVSFEKTSSSGSKRSDKSDESDKTDKSDKSDKSGRSDNSDRLDRSISGRSSLCGTIQFTNPKSSSNANSFLLSVRVCNGATAAFHSLTNEKDSLKRAVLDTSSDEMSLFIGKDIKLKSGDTYKIGVCFYAKDQDGVDEDDLTFGLDLSDKADPQCTGQNCVRSCGNGICSSDENSNSCPIDCSGECSKTVSRRNKKKGVIDGEKVWPGAVIVQMTSNKTSEVCGKIFISHNKDFVALSHVLTFEVPSYKAKVSQFSGFESALIRGERAMLIYRQVADEVGYKKDIAYIAASFCLIPKEGFHFINDIRVGVDLKDHPSYCAPKECSVVCGDLKCDSQTETAANCPVDCSPRP